MARQVGVIPAVYVETQSREQLREEIQAKGWWVSVPLTTFPVHWLYVGDQRLDGRYYANEAFTASSYSSGMYILYFWNISAAHSTSIVVL